MDDILIHTNSFIEHLENLSRVFNLCKQNNIKLNLTKCDFAQDHVRFMGYEVNVKGVKMLDEKVQMIQQLLPPRNHKQLKRLLGIYNYYARFCPNFALIIHPMLKLLKKNVKWEWDEECQVAFDQLKEMFINSCVISHPDFKKTIYLQTDSSKRGIGAILYQKGTKSIHNIIAIGSRVLRDAETRYSTTEREALAIIWACQKFKMYLEGKAFVVVTDHKALTFLLRAHLTNDRLLRWVLFLQKFSFQIMYCPGDKNVLPDYLSRLSDDSQVRETEMEINILDEVIEDLKLNFKDVRNLQIQDLKMKAIIDFKEKGTTGDGVLDRKIRRNHDYWKMYKKVLLINVDKRLNQYKIWYPRFAIKRLGELDYKKFAHFGFTKIYSIIKKGLYCKNLAREFRKIIASCKTCQATKHPNRSYQGSMECIIPTSVSDLYAIDLFGPCG